MGTGADQHDRQRPGRHGTRRRRTAHRGQGGRGWSDRDRRRLRLSVGGRARHAVAPRGQLDSGDRRGTTSRAVDRDVAPTTRRADVELAGKNLFQITTINIELTF